MQNPGYIALFVVLVTTTVYFVLGSGESDPFPPVDNSADYYYCTIGEGIYLHVPKHDRFIYITQHGVGSSKEQKLVKHHTRHEEPFNWHKLDIIGEKKGDLEDDWLAWEKAYQLELSNIADLHDPEKRIKVPTKENPYYWKPKPEKLSFSEYNDSLREDDYMYSEFWNTEIVR